MKDKNNILSLLHFTGKQDLAASFLYAKLFNPDSQKISFQKPTNETQTLKMQKYIRSNELPANIGC